MKKYICLLLAFVMTAGMLCGCLPAKADLNTQPSTTAPAPSTTQSTPPQTTTSVQPTTNPSLPADTGTELESKYTYLLHVQAPVIEPPATWQDPAKVMQWPAIIKSVEELQEFASNEFATRTHGMSDVLDYYDDAFFAEHSLILVCFYIEQGGFCFQLKNCLKMADGSYTITLEYGGPSWGPVIFTYAFLCIEVKDDVPADAVIHVEAPEGMGKLIDNKAR